MTTTTRRRTHWALAGLGTLTLALTATACDPSNGDPTPTPTETETTTEEPTTDEPTSEEPTTPSEQQIRNQNIEEARQTYLEYREVWTEVGQNGFENWEQELTPYLSGSAAQTIIANTRAHADAGTRVEGTQEVVSAEASEYIDDPTGSGGEHIWFEVCLDSTDFSMVDENGDSVSNPPTDDEGNPVMRTVSEVLMQHNQGESWTLHDFGDGGRAC